MDTEAGAFAKIRKLGSSLRRHPFVTGASVLLADGALSKFDGTLTVIERGNQLMSYLFGGNWLADYFASPWWNVTCLALMMAMLWWIGSSGVRAEQKAAKAETEARKRAVRIPVMMAEAWNLRRECQRFADALARSKSLVDEHERIYSEIQERSEWVRHETTHFPTSEQIKRSIDESFSGHALGNRTVVADPWSPVWHVTQPINPRVTSGATVYSVAENQPFFEAERENLDQIIQRIIHLEGLLKKAFERVEAMETHLSDEGSLYG